MLFRFTLAEVKMVCHLTIPRLKLLTVSQGTLPIKSTQGLDGRPRVVEQYGCIVLEVQDWIDGINHPEWQREKKQIFGPGDGAYVLEATYEFSHTCPCKP
jgi:hypothetical protein